MRRLAIAGCFAFIAAGCGRPDSPTRPTTGPPQAPTFNLHGRVFETSDTSRRPIAGARVSGDILMSSAWSVFGSTTTDANGGYSFTFTTGGRVDLWADKENYVQPCFAQANLQADTTIDIELISVRQLAGTEDPRMETASGPYLTGLVFENTPAGPRPIPGARILVEIGDGAGLFTFSNAAGRYFLCRVPSRVSLSVDKPGYLPNSREVTLAGDQVINVELAR